MVYSRTSATFVVYPFGEMSHDPPSINAEHGVENTTIAVFLQDSGIIRPAIESSLTAHLEAHSPPL